MNPTDKVTLEWLMRFEGVESSRSVVGSNPRADTDYMKYLEGNLAIAAENMLTISIMRVSLRGKMASVELFNPTIARFHEAIAFLGAKLPPLRPGEA